MRTKKHFLKCSPTTLHNTFSQYHLHVISIILTVACMFLGCLTTSFLTYFRIARLALPIMGVLIAAQGCVSQTELGSGDVISVFHEQKPNARKTPTVLSQSSIAQQQAILDQREAQSMQAYQNAQRVCYTHFFVNACLAKAQARYRQEKSIRDADRLALADAKRKQRIRERQGRAQSGMMKSPRGHTLTGARAAPRALSHAQQVREVQRRRDNVRRFEAKQRAAERHRLMIERRSLHSRSTRHS